MRKLPNMKILWASVVTLLSRYILTTCALQVTLKFTKVLR